jgi:hypothetical protein
LAWQLLYGLRNSPPFIYATVPLKQGAYNENGNCITETGTVKEVQGTAKRKRKQEQ